MMSGRFVSSGSARRIKSRTIHGTLPSPNSRKPTSQISFCKGLQGRSRTRGQSHFCQKAAFC